jgi:beta-lactamase superfamily II metal-dependent hydrolase
LAWQGVAWLNRPPVQVWFFDVGQGDAILIRSRRAALLIDGGKPGQGTRTLIPALNALGIARVRLAAVTHGDQDHAGGLAELAEYNCLDTLLIGQGLYADSTRQVAEAPALAALLTGACRAVQTVAWHDTIALDRDARFRVLAPPDTAKSKTRPAATATPGR